MIVAERADTNGNKHVLGIREGATGNAAVVAEPLEDIVARSADPKLKILFVFDGSKALVTAVNGISDAQQLVQKCCAARFNKIMATASNEYWKSSSALPRLLRSIINTIAPRQFHLRAGLTRQFSEQKDKRGNNHKSKAAVRKEEILNRLNDGLNENPDSHPHYD